MALTTTSSKSAGIVNLSIIRIVTDAVAFPGPGVDQTFNAGFVPRRVQLVPLTGAASAVEWIEGMPGASPAIRTAATGARTAAATGGIAVYGTNGAAAAAGKQLGDIVVLNSDLPISSTFLLVVEG